MFDALASPRVLRVARGVFIVLLAVGVTSNAIAIRVALDADQGQREGRRVAVQTTCAAISAVIDAGRATILAAGQEQPQPFERNLLKLGYPSLERRRTASELAAATYARSIAGRVAAITGSKGLVRPDGSLDCARLRKAARL